MYYNVWIDWEFAPFCKRWRGIRRILWWLWPVRWVFIRETTNQAANAMAKWVLENGGE